jgi:Na+-translocating ferredoxin:NAD+ oxidoreductase subunit B
MSEDVYTSLREFMDTLPAGFPATPTGVEIKILKKLFTPEQAELTMKLGKEPEAVPAIAARTGIDESELAVELEEMAQKGLIFRVRDGDKSLYQAFQFVVGVYEFQLKTLDKEFCELFEEYLPYLGLSLMALKTKQLRVIPVESSIEAVPAVETYNKVRELVKEQELIGVSQCIGFGLCVSTCPEEAISLVAKPDTTAPPKNFFSDTLIRVKTDRESLAAVQQ